jgi:hypothetical protein
MDVDITNILPVRRGHFALESGNRPRLSSSERAAQRVAWQTSRHRRRRDQRGLRGGATHADLEACGAATVVIAALAVLGSRAAEFAAQAGVALEALAAIPNEIWTAAECPLCARGEPLTSLDGDTNP